MKNSGFWDCSRCSHMFFQNVNKVSWIVLYPQKNKNEGVFSLVILKKIFKLKELGFSINSIPIGYYYVVWLQMTQRIMNTLYESFSSLLENTVTVNV